MVRANKAAVIQTDQHISEPPAPPAAAIPTLEPRSFVGRARAPAEPMAPRGRTAAKLGRAPLCALCCTLAALAALTVRCRAAAPAASELARSNKMHDQFNSLELGPANESGAEAAAASAKLMAMLAAGSSALGLASAQADEQLDNNKWLSNNHQSKSQQARPYAKPLGYYAPSSIHSQPSHQQQQKQLHYLQHHHQNHHHHQHHHYHQPQGYHQNLKYQQLGGKKHHLAGYKLTYPSQAQQQQPQPHYLSAAGEGHFKPAEASLVYAAQPSSFVAAAAALADNLASVVGSRPLGAPASSLAAELSGNSIDDEPPPDELATRAPLAIGAPAASSSQAPAAEAADLCGRQQVGSAAAAATREPRVVGGNSTLEGEFPWAVSIQRHGNHHCGGVIIARRWILTAAHCVRSQSVANLLVRTGGHTLQAARAPQQSAPEHDYQVEQIIMHDDFNRLDNLQPQPVVAPSPLNLVAGQGSPLLAVGQQATGGGGGGGGGNMMKSAANTANNADIALLRLRHDIRLGQLAWPVCFPPRDAGNFSGHEAIVIGWGKLNEKSEEFSNELQKVKLNIIDNKLCQSWFRQAGREMPIDERIICAGFKQGGKDACHGDSGGPLLSRSPSGQYAVVGVVSTGIGCARPLLPGLYSRVSSYIGWIEAHIQAQQQPLQAPRA